MRIVVGLVLLIATFLLGYQLGQNRARAVDIDQRAATTNTEPNTAPSNLIPTEPNDAFGRLLAVLDWRGMVDEVERVHAQEGYAAFAPLRSRLLVVANDLVSAGANDQALQLVSLFVDNNAADNDALLLLAQLWQANDQPKRAVPLLAQILAYPQNAQEQVLAEGMLAEALDQVAASAAEAGEMESYLAFLEELILLNPANDQHRLRLAEAHVDLNRWDEALIVLQETGTTGIEPADRSALLAKVEARMATAGDDQENDGDQNAELRRSEDGIRVTLDVAGKPIQMLVDTGATTTAIKTSRLRALAAEKTDRVARVSTAGGMVSADVYELASVQFGDVKMDNLMVIALDKLPAGVDGLLGLDLLNQTENLAIPAL